MKTSLVGAFVLGLAVAGIGYYALNPKSFSAPSAAVQTPHSEGDGHGHEAGEGKGDAHGEGHEGEEGGIHLTQEQIARSGIERSEEHTSELQSLMRISYAVFC